MTVSIYVGKIKALICKFFSTYAKTRFSHVSAHTHLEEGIYIL